MPKSRRIGLGVGGALALSVAVHLAVVPFVRVARASAEPERSEPPGVVRLLPPMRLTPPPTPRPTPVPTPLPRPRRVEPRALSTPGSVARRRVRSAAQRAPRVAPIGTAGPDAVAGLPADSMRGESSAGFGGASATAEPAASPDPTATPKPTCSAPAVAARVTRLAEPEMPELAREQQAFGTVRVRVDLSERGDVIAASIASSASVLLDAAALDAARRSTYLPEILDCRPVAGSYLFRVDFDG